jgi:hypothetical protein
VRRPAAGRRGSFDLLRGRESAFPFRGPGGAAAFVGPAPSSDGSIIPIRPHPYSLLQQLLLLLLLLDQSAAAAAASAHTCCCHAHSSVHSLLELKAKQTRAKKKKEKSTRTPHDTTY